MVAALVLFSLVGADTPLWQTMLVMVLMGLGLGGNMQPMILAVQNAASPREIGVATSSVTFFRLDGRHARRRDLPLDPVLAPARQDQVGVHGGLHDARVRRRGRRTRRTRGSAAGSVRRRVIRAQRHVVHQPARRRFVAPVQGRLLRLDEHRLPDRRGHHGGRLDRGVLPARAAAAPRPAPSSGPTRTRWPRPRIRPSRPPRSAARCSTAR